MATRLPIPGQDDGHWGQVLNEFLLVEHKDDGTLRNGYIKPAGGIPESDLSSGVQSMLTPDIYVKRAGDSMIGDLSFPETGFLMNDGTNTWRVKINSGGVLYTTLEGGGASPIARVVSMGFLGGNLIMQGYV